MEKAMRGKIERGLVELITNSDDSYRDLEEEKKQILGKIRIEIERRKKGQPTTVIVRDRATGINREQMYLRIAEELGKRTSGFEKGKARRGLHGRGARDIVAFGAVHFDSIKDGRYNRLSIPPSLHWSFSGETKEHPITVTQYIRDELGMPKGDGTVVTIEVESRFPVPQHQRLVGDFSRYFSLRDIFSNPARDVTLIDLNQGKECQLKYNFPKGETVFDEEITIPNYPEAKAHFVIYEHSSAFQQEPLPYREGGILVKSEAAIHDCTYFNLETELFAWRFTGELRCEFIDQLIREYDDREEANPDSPNHPKNNPMRLLDPFRDGLIAEHPFTQALYRECKEILRRFIDKLKITEELPKRDVTNRDLDKKLSDLSKDIAKVFENKIKELEEEIPPGDIKGQIPKLSIGLHIIPPDKYNIIVNQPKIFSIIVKHYETLDVSLPISIVSSNPEDVKVRLSPVFLKILPDDPKVGRTTFTIESSKVGTEAFIEARYDGYEKSINVKVIEPPPPPDLPYGLSFEKPLYHLRINKEKTLTVWLKTPNKIRDQLAAQIISDHPTEIAIIGGGKCNLQQTDTAEVLIGKCRIEGRQLKAKGEITARVEEFEPVKTCVIVEERPPGRGVKFDFKPVEEDFGSVRYKWEPPYLLKIGAKHPSIRKYLGELTEQGYPGIDTQLYHAILAEVIAEALAFRILEIQFKKEGQEGLLDYPSTDTYYHRHFSDFLNIAHEKLVTESM
jgi:hypothetical protein